MTAQAALALDVPPLSQRVTDLAGTMTAAERAKLEARLTAYEQRTTQQFAVLTIPSLEGDPIEDFSIRVVEKWKLGKASQKGAGQSESDNGLLLLVVPKDRKMRIEVGYGLEGKVTDALSSRIIREILRPAFSQKAYAEGIDTAITALMQAGSGEAVDVLPPAQQQDDGGGGLGPVAIFILLALFLMGPRFLFPFFLGSMFGGGRGGGFGGGGGGGFSGGGGGFGGGGASGDW